MAASLDSGKTSDFKDNAMRIGKRMLVGPLDADAVLRACKDVSALTAADILLLLQYFCFGFIFNHTYRHLIVLIFRWNTKQIRESRIIWGHFYSSLDLVQVAIYRYIGFNLQCFWMDFNMVFPIHSILSAWLSIMSFIRETFL